MECPECGGLSEVTKVRAYGKLTWRRHRCVHCKKRFSSYQKAPRIVGRALKMRRKARV